MSGRVIFAGAGPGAPDLLTLRAARAIASADVIIWGRGLLMEEAVRDHARADAEVIAWPPATLDDVLAAYDRAREDGLTVVRLKSGDPSLFGELEPEWSAARERGLACELVPGVSSVAAAAATLGVELTEREAPEILFIAPQGPLDSQALSELAGGGGTAAVLMPGSRARHIQDALVRAGFPGSTPCAVAHRVSFPGEVVLACSLSGLAEQVGDLGLGGLTLFLAGPALGRADER